MDKKNINRKPKFGVAGFPPAFFESEYRKKRENIFEWLSSLDLEWIELQNTYGVKMKDEQAILYRNLSERYEIGISLHAPYYITLASGDKDIVKRSVERIFQCFHLATVIGANRIIVHPGHFPGTSKEERRSGLNQLISVLLQIKSDVPPDIFLYAETAGKKSQLGSIEEIIEICSRVSYVKPCIDVAHVHGFRDGTLTSASSICDILDLLERELGRLVFEDIHFHMYPVEVDKHGEKKHRAFHDRIHSRQLSLFETDHNNYYYPRAEHFIAAIKKRKISPVVVCEALNSQEQGACIMKDLYYLE
jgi:deoxyribonuclease-4